MNDNKQNFISEAIELMKLIDESLVRTMDYKFYLSIKGKVKFPNTSFVSEKQIFWLRDIKDRQLENDNNREEE